ncbi:hypothetical protein FN976_01695 [Caenimonas sedimenti]|uniref:Uncharacterized protein n=1 Tax=Caenimonas sedimenti TaxID=2596921 RepID=A0A562ZY07_9BURK|nr:hypothetical protein FN976_01695 [Caenimonas sedimenti]
MASLVTSSNVRPERVATHARASSLRSVIWTRLKGDTNPSGKVPPLDFLLVAIVCSCLRVWIANAHAAA